MKTMNSPCCLHRRSFFIEGVSFSQTEKEHEKSNPASSRKHSGLRRDRKVTQTILFEKNLENGLLTEEIFQVNPRHVVMACFSTVRCSFRSFLQRNAFRHPSNFDPAPDGSRSKHCRIRKVSWFL